MSTSQRFCRALLPAVVLMLALTGFGWGDRDDDDDDFDATALKSITRMSDYIAKTKQFGVTIDVAYDVVQEWGQKLEFGETREVTLRRPDRFKVATTDRDGAVSGVVFDGRQIAAFNVKDKVYATTPQAGSLDDAIARGDRPLLQRMVITYHRAEAKPQFSAQLRDWNLAPDVSDAVFAFTPPAGATKIAFKPRQPVPGTVSAGDRQ